MFVLSVGCDEVTRCHGSITVFSVKHTWKPAKDWSLILVVRYYGTPHTSVLRKTILSFNKITHHEYLTPLINVPEVQMKQLANHSNVSLCDKDLAAGNVLLILYVPYHTSYSTLCICTISCLTLQLLHSKWTHFILCAGISTVQYGQAFWKAHHYSWTNKNHHFIDSIIWLILGKERKSSLVLDFQKWLCALSLLLYNKLIIEIIEL